MQAALSLIQTSASVIFHTTPQQRPRMKEKVPCGIEYLFLGLCDMAQRNRYQVTRRPRRRTSTFAESGIYVTNE
jgi:hypothetical protein